MMNNYIKLVALSMLACRFVSGDQQSLLCKSLESVCGKNTDSDSCCRFGPRGIPGIKGDSGPPGRPAVVDYDRIDELIEEKVALALAKLESHTETTTPQSTSRAPEPTTATGPLSCNSEGGLHYRQTCYTIPHLSPSQDMDYKEAVAECARTGALLAEFHDRLQQDAVHDLVLSKYPEGNYYIDIWVGMEFQNSTSTLLYRSGKQTPSSELKWLPHFPTASTFFKYLILRMRNDGSSNFGIWNFGYLRTKLHGVLCEKEV